MNISSMFFPQPTNDKEKNFYEILNKFYLEVKSILRNGIRFEDNADCRLVTFTSNGTANTETEVAHTLGKVATGYIVYAQDKAGSLYTSTGGTAWTTTKIYLKCSVSSVTYKIIVI